MHLQPIPFSAIDAIPPDRANRRRFVALHLSDDGMVVSNPHDPFPAWGRWYHRPIIGAAAIAVTAPIAARSDQ